MKVVEEPTRHAQKSRSATWLVTAIGLLVWTALGAVVGVSVASADIKVNAPVWLVLPLVFASLFLVLLFHEGGHVTGGKMAGFRFVFLVVGPLKISNELGGIRVGLNKNLSLYGGLTSNSPTDDKDLRRKMALMVAGGPVASLILGLAGIGLFVTQVFGSGSLPTFLAGVTGSFSLIIFLATIVPIGSPGYVSDGGRLKMLLAGGAKAERWVATTALVSADMANRRPRDWNEQLVKQANSLPDNSYDHIMALNLAFYYALDRAELDRAENYLREVLAAANFLPAAIRPGLYLEAAFFEAYFRQDPAKARNWLEQGKGYHLEQTTRPRAEAAVLLVEGKYSEAITTARIALAQLERSLNPGAAQMQKEWLENIIDQAQAKVAISSKLKT